MTAEPKLTERDWDALGWLMLPLEEMIYGRGSSPIDRLGVRVKGYRMTLLGNLAYCTHLPDDDGSAAPTAEVTKADK